MKIFRAIRELTEKRAALKAAVAEHSKTALRLQRLAEDISRENDRRETINRILRPLNGNGHA